MNIKIIEMSSLISLAKHRNPEVRRWACERARFIHGRDGVAIIDLLLKDNDEDVLLAALQYLLDFPDPKYVAPLAELYKNQTGYIAGMIADYLSRNNEPGWIPLFAERRQKPGFSSIETLHSLLGLGQTGATEAREILETVLSETDAEADEYILEALLESLLRHNKGLKAVLGFYARFFKPHSAKVLHAIVSRCGFPYPFEELQKDLEKRKPGLIDRAVKCLKAQNESHAAETFVQFFGKKLYASAIRWLSDDADSRFINLAAEKDKAFDHQASIAGNCLIALAAFRDYVEWGPEKSHKLLAVAAIVLYSRLVEENSLAGLNFESADADFLFATLFEHRDDSEIDAQIGDILISRTAPPVIAKKALGQIKKCPASFGTARAIELLGKIKCVEAIPAICGLFDFECSDRVYEACTALLVQMGTDFVEYVISGFSGFSDIQKTHFLLVLQDIPREETVDLFLHHWHEFWRCDKRMFVEAIECIAARQFIAPLRQELVPEEIGEERAYYLLCKIHGHEDVILEEIEERLHRKKREFKELEASFASGNPLSMPDRPLKVELKCRSCEKVYSYEVEGVLLDTDSPRIRDKIVCKNCRAINQYDLTTAGKLSLMASLSLIYSGKDGAGIDPEKFPVKVGNVGMMDGRRMPVDEIRECYENDVRNSPDDPALRVGFGNVLMHAGKELEAVFQYKQALRLDPMSVESYMSLGDYESDKGNHEKAHEYFQRAFKYMHVGNYYRAANPEYLRQVIASRLQEYEEGLFSEMADSFVYDMPVRNTAPESGRNDPCPCGSGKKFKKCCMK
ncbi:MAG: SEC-C metal-binding domain-containing protein [Candidatus Riflebacteria bacterium]|nr:SEC-C metal-binding domain-containing protein [Candidatus Riflebacteria bacterium]